jgi:tetratricopeptide (TPR) repeat protein
VDVRYLDPQQELKQRFGTGVLKQVAAEESLNMNQRRWKTSQRGIVQPKKSWPPIRPISYNQDVSIMYMELMKEGDPNHQEKLGLHKFAFRHSKLYQVIEKQFLESIQTHQPHTLMALLQHNPYHANSLLLLSELFKQSGDLVMAADFVERALYVHQRNFHPLFNVSRVHFCRLDYRVYENRTFFIALFRHIYYLGRSGCWRTAYEFCQLLLSLDPETDPLSVLLMNDFYALRSQQYSRYIDWVNMYSMRFNKNILDMPNHAFSITLAYFHRGEKELAEAAFIRACRLFPEIVMELTIVCHWSIYLSWLKCFYKSSVISFLSALYAERSGSLWKDPAVVTWLKDIIQIMARQQNQTEEDIDRKSQSLHQEIYGHTAATNVMRHLFLISDLDHLLRLLPSNNLTNDILSHDPMPPTDSFSSPYDATMKQQNQFVFFSTNNLVSLLRRFFPQTMEQAVPRHLIDPLLAEVDNQQQMVNQLQQLFVEPTEDEELPQDILNDVID